MPGEKLSKASSNSSPLLVSVIIPARDEANSLSILIPKIKESLFGYPYEIIVVDDGSQDKTREVAQSNGAIIVSHLESLGKGAAIKSGAKYASGEVIVFIDGDGAHKPQEIPALIEPILKGEADMVIGSRTLPGSKVSVAPLTRRLTNYLASFTISVVISLLLPIATLFKCPFKYTRITDCTSGFRAIKKEGWQKLSLLSQGFQIETEMIYEAARNRLAIAEVPISCNWDSSYSHLSILKDGLRTLKLLAGKMMSERECLKHH